VGTELRNFSLLGETSGCEHPERAPLYIDNLCRLGLTELRPTRVSDDTRVFRSVEQHREVTAAMGRIASRAPGLAGLEATADPIVPDLQRKGLYVTAFGRQFYEACEYRPEPSR